MHQFPKQIGWVEVVCGSMFSGKTEELIRRVKRAVYGKQRVQVFKPRIDTRYDTDQLVSHSLQKLRSKAIDGADELLAAVELDTQVVGIDEVQFFGPAIVSVCEQLANRGIRVICAGLDLDYRGEPFVPMPELLARAEFITKEQAICTVCGNPANRSQRLVDVPGRVVVGGLGEYEPRCRRCFVPVREVEDEPARPQRELFAPGEGN